MTDSSDSYEAIAIVGMAGRFPMAADIDEYWENLRSGRECLTEFTEDEIVASGVSRDTLIEERRRTRGVLEGAADFDARFFGCSPREAEIMDPQQRVFLEVAWEALEDAGYDSERPPGPIGVYAGSGINTYFAANVATRPDVLGPFGTFPAVVLNEKDFISTRVAYAMDLRGPALTVQTACSTSLVAVCYAAQGLLNYECEVAIAGAAVAVFPQTHSSVHEEGGMISRDGHCRPFDEDASGTLFSDGAGAVVLRRLSDALESGDHIRAVIRGFAVNNDGAGKAGFTAPSVEGQAEVIQLAQEIGGIPPDTISYVETHGTATPLGDPIEIAALTKAFGTGTDRTGFCGIGSVKSNIGHLDVAAGVAGLIKITLALQHRTIPPTVNFERPTPHVAWDTTPFHVVDRLTDWEEGPTPRRAGVSSFGIGGTNAHVVVEEAPSASPTDEEPGRAQLMVLSAKTPTALETATRNLAGHLATTRDDLADVASTLQIGRREFQHRRAIVCVDPKDARAALESPTDRRVLTGSTHHRRKPVVFMFSGQGSQYVDMARGIYESEPEFKAHVDRCAEILQPMLRYDIREAIYPATSDREHATERLRQTAATQPALFVIEYALAMLWQSWGVQPKAMVGHSIGEYVAACLAGVFTLEGALSLVAARGRLMQSLPAGAMLSVPLTEAEIGPLLDARTCVAVINSEGMCVVSGEHDAIDDLEVALSARGVQARRVQTSHAFHSHMMEPILDAFRDEVTKAEPQEPHSPMVSNVTGTWLTPEQAVDPDYWAQHLRQTVRFQECLSTVLEEPDRVLLEVGPGRTLASLTRMHSAKTGDTDVLSSTRHPEESRPDAEFLLESVGRLWIAGASIDWQGLHAHRRRARVPLPTYPFERQRYWLEPGRPAEFVAPSPSTDPRSTADVPHADPREEPSPSQPGAAGDDIERTITTIWEDLLGVSGVGRDEDFFDLGGTSLVAARMFALIARRYGRRLPLSTLVNAPTVATLVAVIRDAEPETPSLVEIQPGDGTKPPLFLIHAEGGHVLRYRDLAMRIGMDWTVVGIQSRGLDGVSEPSDSIEEMAEQYVSEIREVQPHGPYYLGGWCLGGTIAYEMAKQLEHAGERVAWLGMIQARHTSYWASLEAASGVQRLAWGLADRVAFESESVSALNGRAKFRYLSDKTRRKAMRTWARVPIDRQRSALVEELAAANACDSAHTVAYWAYEAPPYDGRVALVRSSNQPRGIAPDPTLGWNDVLRGEVELYEIPSFHKNILDEERAGMVGKVLRESIDASLSREEDVNAGEQPRVV
jgi:acyl transferase domain-containing protein/thioesterase domain-containing protein